MTRTEPRGRNDHAFCAVCATGLALSLASAAFSAQEELNHSPPSSAEEAATPIESGFKARPVLEGLNAVTDWMRKALQNAPPFIRDTELGLKPRTYYYEQQQPSGHVPEAWAAGGSFTYRSGLLADHFRLGAELYTSQPVYAPSDHDGTLLLQPGQQRYTVLGQGYGQFSFSDDELLTAGRKEYNTPYANPQFNRMTPNTFEGVTLQGRFTGLLGRKQFDYLAGYLSEIKLRNADDFIPMSQAAGLSPEKSGTYFAYLLFTAFDASIGLAEYFTPNNLNIFYGEAVYTLPPKGEWGVKLSGQFTGERSVTESLSLSGTPLSRNGGVRATLSYRHAVLTLALSKTAETGQVISPWGSNPSYTAAAIKNTNRAGESAALVSLSYEFSRFGAKGLSAAALFSHAWAAQDATTGQPLKDENERDLLLDYQVQEGFWRGLTFRLQRNVLQGQGDPDATREWRIILNWQIRLM